MQKVQGGPRNLANALETIQLCAAQKPVAEAAITKFLGDYERTSASQSGRSLKQDRAGHSGVRVEYRS